MVLPFPMFAICGGSRGSESLRTRRFGAWRLLVLTRLPIRGSTSLLPTKLRHTAGAYSGEGTSELTRSRKSERIQELASEPRRKTRWLPRWRRRSNPKLTNARATRAPETQGSLGMRDLESREECRGPLRQLLLFEEELGRFFEVGQCLLDRSALTRGPGLGVESHQPSLGVALIDDRRQSLHAVTLPPWESSGNALAHAPRATTRNAPALTRNVAGVCPTTSPSSARGRAGSETTAISLPWK